MQKTIVCLKWGNKYSSQYVNVLFNMCRRHSTEPFNFVCLTEDPKGLFPEIIVKHLPPNLSLQGWWLKPFVFSKEIGFNGEVLFLDLDIVIYDKINKLWDYMPGEFVIIRDFTRHMNPQWQKFNSSVFRFNAQSCHWIWDDFYKDYKKTTNKLHGDQDFLYNVLKNKAKYWPDNWIQSYKWEMRNKTDVQLINGKRNFIDVKDPKLTNECCIAVFHGDPKPSETKDPWVIMNWC